MMTEQTELAEQAEQNGETKAVARPAKEPPKTVTLQSWLTCDALKNEIAKALPKHMTPDRMIRIVMTAMTKTPKLKDCTRESLMNCLITLSQYGLEPDGRNAHLIPYGNVCTLIIDYKGLVELAMRSGMISMIHADVVCENDEFEYDLGEIKKHKIDFKSDRGAVYAAYSIVKFKDESVKCDVMSLSELKAIRNRSKSKDSGPWVTDTNEMYKKTVFKRLSKWLPLSPEYRDAVDHDDDAYEVKATPVNSLQDITATLMEDQIDE